MQHHDVIVIGAGPAGTAAAVRAGELGADVAVIEAARPGGVCTNTGCTPVRVLARTARLLRDARSAATYGVGLAEPVIDWTATMAQVHAVVERARRQARGRAVRRRRGRTGPRPRPVHRPPHRRAPGERRAAVR